MRSDTIVWTPQLLSPIDGDVTKWLEDWLRQGNKTLIYIIPDSGSEADYWTDTVKLCRPSSDWNIANSAAKSINDRIRWRLNRGQLTNSGWFDIDPSPQPIVLAKCTGTGRANCSNWFPPARRQSPLK